METLEQLERDLSAITNDVQALRHIAKNLIKQNMKSKLLAYEFDEETGDDIVINDDDCAYRGMDVKTQTDTKCAIGWLIMDNLYDPDIEGKTAIDDDVLDAVNDSTPNWNKTDKSMAMLSFAQRIHDGYEPKDWQKVFAVTDYKLISPVDGSFRLDKDSIDIVVEDLIKAYKISSSYNIDYPNNKQEKAGK